MHLKLLRKQYTAASTCGQLFSDEVFQCYTLERPMSDMRGAIAPFCIPAGIYKVAMRWSDKHLMNVPGLVNVPGRTDIEIHPGNYPKDTLGCILVGNILGADSIGDSRTAFQNLLRKLQGVTDEINIQIA